VRATVRRELPNLLAAVHGALDAGTPWAVDFANNVSRFLGDFGLSRDLAALNKRAQAAAGERGSEHWYLARSNLGEQLHEPAAFARRKRSLPTSSLTLARHRPISDALP
jgi:hypothetical protein